MIKPGKHLVVNFGWYQHHGISVGDGTVVHFGRGIFDQPNAMVEVVSQNVFSGGREIRVRESDTRFPAEEIVKRALSRVGQRGYDVLENNCEHFVNWCQHGSSESSQITVSETALRQVAAIATRPAAYRMFVRSVTRFSAAKFPGTIARGTANAAILADAAQAAAEIVATKSGKTRSESKQLGKQVGFTSSVTLGFAAGGPVGAVAGVGFWISGQFLGEQSMRQNRQAIGSVLRRV